MWNKETGLSGADGVSHHCHGFFYACRSQAYLLLAIANCAWSSVGLLGMNNSYREILKRYKNPVTDANFCGKTLGKSMFQIITKNGPFNFPC